MCMKYVNATIGCYNSVTKLEDSIVSFNTPLNTLAAQKSQDQVTVGDFSVVTCFNFIGTNNPEHKLENVLASREAVNIIIRLTKCDKDPDKRIGFDLDTFIIDFNEAYDKGKIDTACFDYYNFTRITDVEKLTLPEKTGNYVLKVLIKKVSDPEEKTTIQAMSHIFVSSN